MAFVNISVPTNATLIPIDTRTTNRKVLLLPTVSTNPGRSLTIKDYYGATGLSSLTISTTGTDFLEGNVSRITMSNEFASVALVADGLRTWQLTSFYTEPASTFLPTSIANLSIWFDAADTTTLQGGTSITGWVNKGTAGGTATQQSVANPASITQTPPTYGNTTYGPLGAFKGLQFVQGNELDIQATFATSVRSFFFVFRANTVSTTSLILPFGVANKANFMDIGVQCTAGSFLYNISQNGVGAVIESSSTTFATFGSIYIVSMVNSTTTSENLIRVNGTPLTLTTSLAAPYTNTNQYYRMNFASTSAFWSANYDIGELILYNSVLTAASDVPKIEGYLAWKWGLQTNLNASHPYRYARP